MTTSPKIVTTPRGELRVVETEPGRIADVLITPKTPEIESGKERAFSWKIRVRDSGEIRVVKDTSYVGETASFEIGPTSTSRISALAFLSTHFVTKAETALACTILLRDINFEREFREVMEADDNSNSDGA